MFSLINKRSSSFSGLILFLFGVNTCPASLKMRSDLELAAWTENTTLSKWKRSGNWSWWILHQSSWSTPCSAPDKSSYALISLCKCVSFSTWTTLPSLPLLLLFPANCFLRRSVGDKFYGNWTSSLFSRISSVVSSSLHSLCFSSSFFFVSSNFFINFRWMPWHDGFR